ALAGVDRVAAVLRAQVGAPSAVARADRRGEILADAVGAFEAAEVTVLRRARDEHAERGAGEHFARHGLWLALVVVVGAAHAHERGHPTQQRDATATHETFDRFAELLHCYALRKQLERAP